MKNPSAMLPKNTDIELLTESLLTLQFSRSPYRGWKAELLRGLLTGEVTPARFLDELKSTEARTRALKEYQAAKESGTELLTVLDQRYPERLRQIHNPPPILYCFGETARLADLPAVGIVGTRRASRGGNDFAQNLARRLADCGVSIVSGLAHGIDGAAHRGGCDSSGHPGIAVLGTGVRRIYPPDHSELAAEIVRRGGVLISETSVYGDGEHASFLQRNRIISGLSNAVVVVEAPEKSGAMATARFALEQGRELLAVPGGVGSGITTGTNRLLRDGARVVLDEQDVMGALPEYLQRRLMLPLPRGNKKESEKSDKEGADPLTNRNKSAHSIELEILRYLAREAQAFPEELASACALTTVELLPHLTNLELSGRIVNGGGVYFRGQ